MCDARRMSPSSGDWRATSAARASFSRLCVRGSDLESKSAVELAHYGTFDAADAVEVGDHALADLYGDGGHHRGTADGHIDEGLQGCSCLFSRMKRPSIVTDMRLWQSADRERCATARSGRDGQVRAGCRTFELAEEPTSARNPPGAVNTRRG